MAMKGAQNKRMFIRKKEFAGIMKQGDATIRHFGGQEIIFPSEANKKQGMFCKLKMEGWCKDDVKAELGLNDFQYNKYLNIFKPFIMQKLVELNELRKGDNLLIIREQIRHKQRQMQENPEKDKSDLHDWVRLDSQLLSQDTVSKSPQSSVPLVVLVDNRENKEEEPKQAEIINIKESPPGTEKTENDRPPDHFQPSPSPVENTGK